MILDLGRIKMNRMKKFVGLAAFSLMVLALPSIASAQWGGNNGRYGGYGNNGNNGYYGNIRQNIQNIKNRARTFEREANRGDDRGGRYGNYGGYNNGNIYSLAKSFRRAVDDLMGAYNNGRDMGRSSDEARRVLDLGSQISQEMYRSRSNGNMQYEWGQINNDLDVIAAAYGYNNNNNGRYRGNRNGGRRNNSPFPF